MEEQLIRLRLKNPVPANLPRHYSFPHLAPNSPWKPREAAKDEASKKCLRTPDPHAYTSHPLARTKTITIDMEFDEETASFVTYVQELHRMSTFGSTEMEALDSTAEMIRGYIKSMEANHKRVPLAAAKLRELKHLFGLR